MKKFICLLLVSVLLISCFVGLVSADTLMNSYTTSGLLDSFSTVYNIWGQEFTFGYNYNLTVIRLSFRLFSGSASAFFVVRVFNFSNVITNINSGFIAESSGISTSSMTSYFQYFNFTFLGMPTLNGNSPYLFLVCVKNATTLDSSNNVMLSAGSAGISSWGIQATNIAVGITIGYSCLDYYLYGNIGLTPYVIGYNSGFSDGVLSVPFNGNATIDKVYNGYSFYSNNSTLKIGTYNSPSPFPSASVYSVGYDDGQNEGLIIGIIIAVALSLLLTVAVWKSKK